MTKFNRSKTSRVKQRGQGMTEYIIIVGLIAIFLIVAVKKYGKEIDVAIQGSGNAVRTVIPAGGRGAVNSAITLTSPNTQPITGGDGEDGRENLGIRLGEILGGS